MAVMIVVGLSSSRIICTEKNSSIVRYCLDTLKGICCFASSTPREAAQENVIACFDTAYRAGDLTTVQIIHQEHALAFDDFIAQHQPLHLALCYNKPNLVVWLLDQSISCTQRSLKDKCTTLYYFNGISPTLHDDEPDYRPAILKKLVAKGCAINALDYNESPLSRYLCTYFTQLKYDDSLIKTFIAQGASLVCNEGNRSCNVLSRLLDRYERKVSPEERHDQQVYVLIKALFFEKIKSIKQSYFTTFNALACINKDRRAKNLVPLPRVIVAYIANQGADAAAYPVFDALERSVQQGDEAIPSVRDRLDSDSRYATLKDHSKLRRLLDIQSLYRDWHEFKVKKSNSPPINSIVQAFNKK
jgi:hypothetical protein